MEHLHFIYRDEELLCEAVPVRRIAEKIGTPVFVYSRDVIQRHFQKLVDAFRQVETLVCYSVKALGNLAICQVLRDVGAGFDVVSGGELFRALQAGGRAKKIVFAGVGKSAEEIEFALDRRILMFNVESEPELRLIDLIATQKGMVADIALRVNPDVDPKTHTYISTGKRETKFGLDLETAERLAAGIPRLTGIRMIGVHVHIGSQITQVESHVAALRKAIDFADRAKGLGNPVEWINLGGGFGIHYREVEAPPVSDYADVLLPLIAPSGYRLIIEPGRFIVGNAGLLLTRVLYVKRSGDRRFIICDAGMNDLIRPALYGAWHEVWPVSTPYAKGSPASDAASTPADVVGPVCESADFLARDRMLPPVKDGDLMAVFSAGAYGMSMASNYNGRPRPAEVLVSGSLYEVIRTRETWDDLIRGERKVARWD
jgi:diaminopimelate decarboxylase